MQENLPTIIPAVFSLLGVAIGLLGAIFKELCAGKVELQRRRAEWMKEYYV